MTHRKKIKRIFRILMVVTGGLMILLYFYIVLPVWGYPFNKQRHGTPPLTPSWALECWLWEDDVNTAGRVDELLDGYARNDIPVRTILIDSPWSTMYNDYTMDTLRYPHPEVWFTHLQDNGYRVVLWTTCMVNSYNKDTRIQDATAWFDTARKRGFLTGNGYEIKWWKGKGGFIDYTNPEAMKWWHGLQQQVLKYGIDGWKLDGTATLFRGKLGPLPVFYQKTESGIMSTRKYMDHYYRDEYNYGVQQDPAFITLSRAMDRNYHPEGFAPVDAAPVNWVGDQEHYWKSGDPVGNTNAEKKDIALKGIQGFESAIVNILKSADRGYSVIGSDVAGFSGSDIPPRLYIRWAQFSTFCGLFLNGGHGERALWKRSPEEMRIIRKYAWLHTELVPYMYHYIVRASKEGRVLQKPVSGELQYLFGDDLLIAPIYRDTLSREVSLPAGKWRYWFNDTSIINGPSTLNREYPLDEYPVYIKEGAIIPMHIERAYTGIGDERSKGYLTCLIYPDGNNSFTVYHPDNRNKTTSISVTDRKDTLKISFTGEKVPHILAIHLDKQPQNIKLDEKVRIDSANVYYIHKRKKLMIKTDDYLIGTYLIVK